MLFKAGRCLSNYSNANWCTSNFFKVKRIPEFSLANGKTAKAFSQQEKDTYQPTDAIAGLILNAEMKLKS